MVGFRAHGGELVYCIIQQPKGTVQQFIDNCILLLFLTPFYLKSRRGESNFISAIRSIIDADMARQQRVHGILKDFAVIKCSIVVHSTLSSDTIH